MAGKFSIVAATAANITSMYAIVQFNGAGQKSKCLKCSNTYCEYWHLYFLKNKTLGLVFAFSISTVFIASLA